MQPYTINYFTGEYNSGYYNCETSFVIVLDDEQQFVFEQKYNNRTINENVTYKLESSSDKVLMSEEAVEYINNLNSVVIDLEKMINQDLGYL